MTKIMDIAHKYNLKVVEDCAQSHGNHWENKTVGTFGDIGCFSFYPSKGCGAFGDAGCIVTDNEEIADKFRVFRNYGSRVRYQNEVVGANSILDELQAGLLRVKLKHLNEFNDERNKLVKYLSGYIVAPYLFLAPLLQMLFQVACNQFIVVKKTWPNMFILSVGAIVNIIANYFQIPRIGIEGAAIATL